MPNSYLPLSWESTGDQWWYATPIDWAAANGLSDLVKELLLIDPNLLIKLTSLRRTHRLETVWEDTGPHNNVACCRARVARSLLMDCEPKDGNGPPQPNSLMSAGYGGWLLYTAAAAGDVGFVKDLLQRDPLLVELGGGREYGVAEILYGAARSKDSEVFKLLLESAMNVDNNKGRSGEVGKKGFEEEMMNIAVHAAAKGGNLEVLKELLLDCSDVLCYTDDQGSTILHSAAGTGHLQVVEYLIATHSSIINSADNQGNTALHVAAHRGYSFVVKVLASASHSLTPSRNNGGNTFLHMAVTGFRSPGFRQIDQQTELIKRITSGEITNLEEIINVRNNQGRTALHIAVAENIQCHVIDLLMGVPSINLNIYDSDGLTPLNLLKQCRKTATSNLLVKQLDENQTDLSCELHSSSSRFSSCSSEVTSSFELDSYKKVLSGSVDLASRHLKLIQFPRKDGRKPTKIVSSNTLTPLRQQYAKEADPSRSVRERFAANLMQGVVQGTPPKSCLSLGRYSSSSLFPESLPSSPCEADKLKEGGGCKNVGRSGFFSGPLSGERLLKGGDKHRRTSSFNKSVMNQYFCFGAQGLTVEDSDSRTDNSCRRLVF